MLAVSFKRFFNSSTSFLGPSGTSESGDVQNTIQILYTLNLGSLESKFAFWPTVENNLPLFYQ